MEPVSDGELEARIVALLTDLQLPLLCYVRSLVPERSAARDVAQNVNATIWEKRAEFELGTNFKAWAFSVARFEILNFRKKQARDARLMFGEDLVETIAEEMADDPLVLQDRHEALQSCLRKLRPGDRDLLLHRYSSGVTLSTYAEKVGRSVGGLKVTLHRLRNALLACIQRELSGQETPS